MAGFVHRPVLLEETVALLTGGNGRRFVDGTLGGGGHSERLLDRDGSIEVLGLDCDREALAAASRRLERFGGRFAARKTRFSRIEEAVREHGWAGTVDGVLLDVGVSSPQIDTPERGFSFRFDAPLDMRMDRDSRLTAAVVLNTWSEEDIADILRRYGEERRFREIARAVVERRRTRLWERTGEFAELVEKVVGRAHQHGLPPATRSFQALRIAVNRELDELREGLDGAYRTLSPGGLLAVISFHSLEDRMVKNYFRLGAAKCVCPPGLPVCVCGKVQTWEIVTRKPVRAGEAELAENPRAGSARLRVGRKLA